MIGLSKAVLVSLVLGIASCASVPVAEVTPGERPAVDTDEAGLWQAMDRDEYRLQTSSEVIRHADLQRYVEAVLCRVAPDHCEDVRAYVVPSRDFNALMAPNGMMIVFTGLLVRLASEAELAAVIGHEVAHYLKRHSLQQIRDVRNKTNVLQTTGAILSAGVGVATARANAASSAGQYGRAIRRYDAAFEIAQIGSSLLQAMEIYTVLSVLAYSRDQELEADHLGITSIAEAGYPPEAAGDVWRYMMEEERHRARTPPGYLRTHPGSAQRQREAALIATKLGGTQGDLDRAVDYMAQIAPFRNEWLHHARRGMSFEQQRTLMERQRDIGVGLGLVAFHEAQMYRQRGDSGDADKALSLLETAAQNEGHPVETWRDLGLMLSDAGRSADAKVAFEEYLQLAPDAADVLLILGYLHESIPQ